MKICASVLLAVSVLAGCSGTPDATRDEVVKTDPVAPVGSSAPADAGLAPPVALSDDAGASPDAAPAEDAAATPHDAGAPTPVETPDAGPVEEPDAGPAADAAPPPRAFDLVECDTPDGAAYVACNGSESGNTIFYNAPDQPGTHQCTAPTDTGNCQTGWPCVVYPNGGVESYGTCK